MWTKISMDTAENTAKNVIDMDADDAKAMLNAHGVSWRIAQIDGKRCILTADLRMDRVNITISDGKVVGADVG
jgi:hypothetical protein